MMTMKNADYEKCPFTIVGMIKELHRKIHAGSKEAVEKALEHLTSYIVRYFYYEGKTLCQLQLSGADGAPGNAWQAGRSSAGFPGTV
jgi:hypothetical protein